MNTRLSTKNLWTLSKRRKRKRSHHSILPPFCNQQSHGVVQDLLWSYSTEVFEGSWWYSVLWLIGCSMLLGPLNKKWRVRRNMMLLYVKRFDSEMRLVLCFCFFQLCPLRLTIHTYTEWNTKTRVTDAAQPPPLLAAMPVIIGSNRLLISRRKKGEA